MIPVRVSSDQPGTSKPSVAHSAPARRNGRQGTQDVSHLLGFSFSPRAAPPPTSGPPRRSAKRHTHNTVFDKQRYVHQAFRFVVKPDKDYTQHFADADVRLDWGDVLQVIVDTTSALSSAATSMDQPTQRSGKEEGAVPVCPICLDEPTAPRMTKCGHVFCYGCMLHYLALAEPGMRWRRCPVCWENVYANDLRSVHFHDPIASVAAANLTPYAGPSTSAALAQPTASEHRLPTEPLQMRLVRRPPISTLALPRSSTWPSEAVPPLRAPWQFVPDVLSFAKIILASPDLLKHDLELELATLKKEVADLRRWAGKGGATSDEELGVMFALDAVKKVEEQIAATDALKANQMVMNARKRALKELQAVQERAGRLLAGPPLPAFDTSSSELEEDAGNAHLPQEFLESLGHVNLNSAPPALNSSAPVFTPGGASAGPSAASNGPLASKGRPPRRNVNPAPEETGDGSYLFYQAASGQNIFLQPLDIKVLKAHFGHYSAMPDTIEVLVEGTDEGSMNDELRRRCKWLSHLPTGSDVVFIEADLTRVVDRKALEPYAQPLKQRRMKRRDKARRDDKAKLKSELRAQEELPAFAPTQTYEPSMFDLPPLSTNSFPPARSTTAPPESNPAADQHGTSPQRPTVWGTAASSGTFASALHSSSRGGHRYDEGYDDRWDDWEDHVTGGGRGGNGGGASSGSNAGGGQTTAAQGEQITGGGRRGKKKKLVLNLTAGAGRGV